MRGPGPSLITVAVLLSAACGREAAESRAESTALAGLEAARPAATPRPPARAEPAAAPSRESRDVMEGLDPSTISTAGREYYAERHMTPLPLPGPGRAVRDPEFGTRIRQVSDAHPGNPAAGRYGIRTLYTGTSAWNINETLMVAYAPGVGHHLYRGGAIRHRKGPLSGEPRYDYISRLAFSGIQSPTDIERVYWSMDREDPLAPVTLYFPNQRYQLVKAVLPSRVYGTSASLEVLHDFSPQCGRFGTSSQLLTETHSGPSFDGSTWGFKCGPNPGAQIFAYDMRTDTVLWQKTHEGREEWGLAGTPMPTPSGEFFVVRSDAGIQLWDRRGRSVGWIRLPFEHYALTLSREGDLYVTVVFDQPAALSGTVVSCGIPSGACELVAGQANGYPYPPSGTHHSGMSFLNPGWVATSIIGFQPLDGRRLLNQELLLTDLRDPRAPRVARVAHHRSARDVNPNINFDYWQEPHPVLSPSGCRIAFTSDWSAGHPPSRMNDRVNVFVVELPCFEPVDEVDEIARAGGSLVLPVTGASGTPRRAAR